MTYTHYVDCEKWQKIIGISLWIAVSIAIGYAVYFTIGLYGTEKYGLYLDQNKIVGPNSDHPFGDIITTTVPDYGTQLVCIAVAIFMNIVNYSFVWRTLNRHYKWLEIKCGKKEDEASG